MTRRKAALPANDPAAIERRRQELAQRPKLEPLPLWHETVQGGKLVSMLQRTVDKFRAEDAPDAHGNRELYFDDVLLVYLLAFFNPTIRTLRTFEDFSQTQQAQRHLTTQRICKSTLSDFHKIAEPERLAPLIAELRTMLTRKFASYERPAGLQGLLKQVLAVDGTFFAAAADVAWAVGKRNQHVTKHRARIDVHVDIHTWLPEVIAIPEPGEGEAHRAAQAVKPDAIHVYDRGYGSFELIAAHYQARETSEKTSIKTTSRRKKQSAPQHDTAQHDVQLPAAPERDEPLEAKAQFVLRCKTNQLHFAATQTSELTDEQRARGIVSDRVGYLTGSSGNRAPHVLVREVVIRTDDGSELRLLTNLLDVAAEVIGELYRQRWQIELFFRWLKCYANFDHLISHDRRGVLLNFYVVIIGVMLMYLHTGGRPSKYALALLGTVASGGGDLESILPILRERERQCEVERQGAARRRARKKAAGL